MEKMMGQDWMDNVIAKYGFVVLNSFCPFAISLVLAFGFYFFCNMISFRI